MKVSWLKTVAKLYLSAFSLFNRDRIMSCVTPSDVNTEIARVRVQTPTRMFSFNRRGDANMSFAIFQVVCIYV